MRERDRDRGRLEHIMNAINGILTDKELYTFEEFRGSHPDVNWRQIEKMRHVLVHGYYTIDPESLWDTIQEDIPELKPWIEKYLEEEM